jgi:hypothetical protein
MIAHLFINLMPSVYMTFAGLQVQYHQLPVVFGKAIKEAADRFLNKVMYQYNTSIAAVS